MNDPAQVADWKEKTWARLQKLLRLVSQSMIRQKNPTHWIYVLFPREDPGNDPGAEVDVADAEQEGEDDESEQHEESEEEDQEAEPSSEKKPEPSSPLRKRRIPEKKSAKLQA